MKVPDLFSGIGGFSLGLERAGMETAAFCEIEEYPRKVLNKHWPDVPIYGDVRELTAERMRKDGVESIDVICGGFPCQPYSRANWKRQGRGDARDMSCETIRLVSEFEPAVFIGENTEGFVDIGLSPFIDDLEEIGYFAQALSIPACAVGLPTLERHVWIIAAPSSERLQRIVEETIQNIESLQGELQGGNQGIGERWHLPESRVYRAGEGLPDWAHRNKALGNAVDPIMPELIGRAVISATNPPIKNHN